ncbi:MAG: hypothetical protein HRT74_12085 [Flavobacteriales bacterium]|nr:hypothetical protein [Flavobacteriales bacterium]
MRGLGASLLFFFAIAMAFGCKDQPVEASPEPVVLDLAEEDDVPVPPAPAEPVLPDTLVFYKRTACFGQCPTFEFTVLKDGKCLYHGRNFVDRIGKYKGQVEMEDLTPIFDQAQAMGYDTLQSVYDNRFVTDLPAKITTIMGKTVMNRYQGPNLTPLYDRIDLLIEDIEWAPNTDQ